MNNRFEILVPLVVKFRWLDGEGYTLFCLNRAITGADLSDDMPDIDLLLKLRKEFGGFVCGTFEI